MAESPHVCVLVNPVSGRAGSWQVVRGLCRRARKAGWSVSVHETQGPGDAKEVAGHCCRASVRALVVAGGDGTVSEAAGGMAGDGVPILVAPRGTENILGKYFGAAADPELLWQVLRGGREAVCDVPRMNGRRFLILGGIGFDAEAVHRLARDRRGHITYLSYFWPTWRTFWGHPFREVTVEADGRPLFQGRAMVFVGNIPRYAVGFRILARARPDDRLLDVCILPCRGQGAVLRHAANLLLRRHIGRSGVIYQQARQVRVWAEEAVPVQLDGDAAGCLPATFEMTKDRVRFLVPHGWKDEG